MANDKIKNLISKLSPLSQEPSFTEYLTNRIKQQVKFEKDHNIEEGLAYNNATQLLNELQILVEQANNTPNSILILHQLERSIKQIVDLTTVNELSINLTDITEVHLNYRLGDVILLPTNSTKLIISDLMSRDIPHLYSNIEKVGNVVHVTQGPRKLVGIFRNKTLVFLPKSYDQFLTIRSETGKLTLLGVQSPCMLDLTHNSGQVFANNLHTNRFQADLKSSNLVISNSKSNIFHINTHSGKIKLGHISSDSQDSQLSITTTSGNVQLNDISTNDLSVETKSGTISLNSIASPALIQSSNGDIKWKQFIKTASIRTTSGNCKICLDKQFKENLDITSKRGDITVILPDETFPIRFDCNSKRGSIDLPMDSILYTNESLIGFKGYLEDEDAPGSITTHTETGKTNIKA